MSRKFNKVFLVGYMGSGKSFLGEKIAKKLDFRFIDTDTYIEKMSEKSISSIFSEHGEAYFRKLETQAIHKISEMNNLVVATGGGLPCASRNMDILLKNGIVIFLDTNVKLLMLRLLSEKSKRPMIAKFDNQYDLNIFIKAHLSKRLPIYEKAHLSISISDDDLDFLNPLIQYLKIILSKS